MLAWMHGQQPGQWRGQQQGGNRAQQGPWPGGQAAVNPFSTANYMRLDGTFVTVEAENRAHAYAASQGRAAGNSDILRASLIESGVPEPDVENQAHHIVESSNEEGQRILRACDIESNSAVNGVFLPTAQPDGSPDLTTHLGSHVREYRECVNRALTKAANSVAGRDPIARQQAVVNCLNAIRNILLTEVLPLNSGVDADYNPDTDSGMTIEDIFLSWGLIDRQ